VEYAIKVTAKGKYCAFNNTGMMRRQEGGAMQILRLNLDTDTEFDAAQSLAVTEASKYLTAPMLLSWLDRKKGRHSPNVDCCQQDGKEAWEIYAESRGGTLRIEIGHEYVFILREGIHTGLM